MISTVRLTVAVDTIRRQTVGSLHRLRMLPSACTGHSSVWTTREMIVWGGSTSSGLLITGGRYDPIADSWSSTNINNTPVARFGQSAVWTGREMIVWGGYYYDGDFQYLDTGGRYFVPPVDLVNISGIVANCSEAVTVPNVVLTLAEGMSGATSTDSTGGYALTGLLSGRSYIVTPSKTPRVPGSVGIDTIDVVATQRHYLWYLAVDRVRPNCWRCERRRHDHNGGRRCHPAILPRAPFGDC